MILLFRTVRVLNEIYSLSQRRLKDNYRANLQFCLRSRCWVGNGLAGIRVYSAVRAAEKFPESGRFAFYPNNDREGVEICPSGFGDGMGSS